MYRITNGLGAVKVLLTDYADPMDIMNGKKPYSDTDELQRLLGATDLYAVLRRDAVLIGVIAILVLLISMLFVKKSDLLAEKKKDLMHKFGIVFLISTLITLLNFLTLIFETVLY